MSKTALPNPNAKAPRTESPLEIRHGELHWEGQKLEKVMGEIPTPCYLYSANAAIRQFEKFQSAATKHFGDRHKVYYALKANPYPPLVKELQKAGAGVDAVSVGEWRRAKDCGVPLSDIVFSGVGKTREEMQEVIEGGGCHSFNVESFDELEELNQLAQGSQVPVALRLNPDVRAATHHHIATGGMRHKFGIMVDHAREILRKRSEFPNLNFIGLSIHIGSQLKDLSATRRAVDILGHLAKEEFSDISFVDVGGGLGIDYEEGEEVVSVHDYMESVQASLSKHLDLTKLTVGFEPGRYLVARCGVLISQVTRVKEWGNERFMILDAGMNDFMRPGLYQAHHDIFTQYSVRPLKSYHVVGPVCESTDTFAMDRELPEVCKGDYVAISDVGAYGHCLSNQYNLRALPREKLTNSRCTK